MTEVEMQRVDGVAFWSHLDKWSLVTFRSQPMLWENEAGKYYQTGYFGVLEVQGFTLIADESNLLGAVRKPPSGKDPLFFINLNARPDPL